VTRNIKLLEIERGTRRAPVPHSWRRVCMAPPIIIIIIIIIIRYA